jgi:hypothetical protein
MDPRWVVHEVAQERRAFIQEALQPICAHQGGIFWSRGGVFGVLRAGYQAEPENSEEDAGTDTVSVRGGASVPCLRAEAFVLSLKSKYIDDPGRVAQQLIEVVDDAARQLKYPDAYLTKHEQEFAMQVVANLVDPKDSGAEFSTYIARALNMVIEARGKALGR